MTNEGKLIRMRGCTAEFASTQKSELTLLSLLRQ